MLNIKTIKLRKHAYLIIAHHEPEILRLLVNALDDDRNDIYIHFDKKYQVPPNLEVQHSSLFILEKRIDVRWGDCSQINVELLLFEAAYKNNSYSYYHLLSGVDFPIKSQNYIHSFFNKNNGKQFVGFSQGDLVEEIDRKIRRYHLFPREFRNGSRFSGLIFRVIRKVFLEIQICFDLKRHRKLNFKKGTNWVSITTEFVELLLSKKKEIMKMYSFTFCADEIYKQTICWNSPFRDNVYDLSNSLNSSKRMIRWVDNKLIDWRKEDIDYLLKSSGLFARKFSSDNIDAIRTIMQKIKDH